MHAAERNGPLSDEPGMDGFGVDGLRVKEPELRSVACTHVGLVRKHNEDSFLDRPDIGLWAVADGMGGMTAGEVASQAIVAALGGIAGPLDAIALTAEIRDRVASVNRNLLELAEARGPGTVIGSTLAGLVVRCGHFACFWAGDSRVYRLRAGELDQLTRDHSLVQDMVDAGLLRPEDAERHPHANVVQRAVGVDDDLVLDWVHARIVPGDVFLICTDGLTRMVGPEELEQVLATGGIAQTAPALIDLALARGARDNVTVVLVAA